MTAAELRAWLRARLALADKATGGPWEVRGDEDYGFEVHGRREQSGIVGLWRPTEVCAPGEERNAEFIADARGSLPAVVAAILRVLYIDEDELPSRSHDVDYQEGVSDALLHVKKAIFDQLGEVAS